MTNCSVPKDFAKAIGDALVEGDELAAVKATKEALEAKVDPLAIIQTVIVPSLTEVGRRFETLEIFLPELMQAGAVGAACSELVERELNRQGGELKPKGIVVIGTVKGDIHDIGKNIVATLLKANGYRVIDLGKDVSAIKFVEAAETNKAQVIAASALMSVTRAGCRDIATLLNDMKLMDKYPLIIGGGSTDQAYADQIGARGYSPTASGAVQLVDAIVAA